MTIASNVVSPEEIVSQAHHRITTEKLIIRLTLIISLFAGSVLFLLFKAINPSFTNGQIGLALLALTAMAFESTWIIYGFAALIHKSFSKE